MKARRAVVPMRAAVRRVVVTGCAFQPTCEEVYALGAKYDRSGLSKGWTPARCEGCRQRNAGTQVDKA